MTRRFAALALSMSLALTFLVSAPAAAVSSAPIPASMAAVGDSITQAASTGGSLGADAPENSWSTGTNSTVNSHFLRLLQLSPNLVAYNRSVSGAKVANLPAQMDSVVAITPDPGYLTVLIGGNDLCTDTVAQMTPVDDFRRHFTTAMTTITTGSPNTYVYVVSIPDVYQLWELFKGNFWARFIWNSAKICQSLLANPTSTQTADVERRAAVRQRNIDYNLALEQICESASFSARCHFDGHAAFDVEFTRNDVSGDYFHPSIAGQAKLASVSWGAGFTWTSSTPQNQAPTAAISVPSDCTTGTTCTGFSGVGSSDPDGNPLTYTWDFGDGTPTVAGQTVNHTYTSAAGSPYTVTLTVSDGVATDTATASVRVSDPAAENGTPVAVISAPLECTTGVTCTGFSGEDSSDPDGDPLTYTWDFGDGAPQVAGQTASHTYTSSAGSPYTVTLTVSDGEASSTETASVVVTDPPPPTTGIELTVSAYKVKGVQHADLTWSGATTGVDIYRDGARIETNTANDGQHTDNVGQKGGGTHTYQVCETGTETCSPVVTASY